MNTELLRKLKSNIPPDKIFSISDFFSKPENKVKIQLDVSAGQCDAGNKN